MAPYGAGQHCENHGVSDDAPGSSFLVLVDEHEETNIGGSQDWEQIRARIDIMPNVIASNACDKDVDHHDGENSGDAATSVFDGIRVTASEDGSVVITSVPEWLNAYVAGQLDADSLRLEGAVLERLGEVDVSPLATTAAGTDAPAWRGNDHL